MTVMITKAVLEGAIGMKSPFVRTPKFSVEGKKGEWKTKKYRGRVGWVPFVEIGFGLYFSYVIYYAWFMGIYGVIPFLFLFQFGYLFTGVGSLMQGLKQLNLALPKTRLRFRLFPAKEELDPRPEKA